MLELVLSFVLGFLYNFALMKVIFGYSVKSVQNYIIFLCSTCSNALALWLQGVQVLKKIQVTLLRSIRNKAISLWNLCSFCETITCWELPVNSFCLSFYFTLSLQLLKRESLWNSFIWSSNLTDLYPWELKMCDLQLLVLLLCATNFWWMWEILFQFIFVITHTRQALQA